MSDLFEFERAMIKHNIKFYKKMNKTFFFSFSISLAVLAFNIPVIMHHPERWLNAICCGAMIFNMIWLYTEWRMNLIEVKDLYKREAIYKKYELKQKQSPIPSDHILDAIGYMSNYQSSSGLPK